MKPDAYSRALVAFQRHGDVAHAARELAAAGGATPKPFLLHHIARAIKALARLNSGAAGAFWAAANAVVRVLDWPERRRTPDVVRPLHRELQAATQQLDAGPVRDAGQQLVDALQHWIEALEDAR